jgi:hypothetical protein
MERDRQSRFLLLALVLIFPVAVGACNRRAQRPPAGFGHIWPWMTVQEDGGEGGDEVKPEDVEKYINVYEAMQRNRRLTVEQAAASQNLTVEQFRDIESRIERDGVLRERVRRQLLKTAQQRTQDLGLHKSHPAAQ